ncbi:hypothetical protein EV645_3995 [Kribbella rubisoli]|uniref:Uncharacterized protein n=2 Tax=Kribbella rubisoli TaxID=3075929 RepID=A0A4Q7X0V7_9ACTN|nr:hypothetical protein EV645_3995 [Kribbella rubisoli]
MATEDVYAVALNVLSAVVDAPGKEDAILDVHNLLRDLDEVALRRVAGCIAIELVWSRLPVALAHSLPGRERDAGLVQAAWQPAVRRWVDQLRLEVAWQAPDRSSEEATS